MNLSNPLLFQRLSVRLFGLCLGLSLLLPAPPLPASLAAGWYTECKVCAEKLGGNGLSGPWPSKEACEEGRTTGHNVHYPYGPCFSVGVGGASSSASSGNSDLEKSTADALAFGLTHGNGEALGLGMMGLGVLALTSAPQGPSPAQQAAEQQAANERAARYQAQQAAKQREFVADRDATANEIAMKDGVSDGAASRLKGEEDEDGFKPVPMKGKKKWKAPRLKPMANPLDKQPLEGDMSGASFFDDWDKAKIFAANGNGTIGQESTGKIVWCPTGFPYYCGKHCYSNDAFNSLRVPCPSKLQTRRVD